MSLPDTPWPHGLDHPLPIGSHVSYADYSPRVNCTVLANSQDDPVFLRVVQAWNEKYHKPHGLPPIEPSDLDYVVLVDDELEVIPVQAGGIAPPISDEEHQAALV